MCREGVRPGVDIYVQCSEFNTSYRIALYKNILLLSLLLLSSILISDTNECPGVSPSRGADVAVYVFDIDQRSWPTPFLFCSNVYFCLSCPFSCISFHKFSRHLSDFSLCSSGLISALLVLSTIYLLMKASYSPDIILCG